MALLSFESMVQQVKHTVPNTDATVKNIETAVLTPE